MSGSSEREKWLAEGRNCLAVEATALQALQGRLGDEFVAAVECILQCSGRVVVTGMGKSGWIGRKISATLASTGTPSFFLHPAEAIHGDLGMTTAADVVLAISYSGESAEMNALLPAFKRIGVSLIAMCRAADSTLAKHADLFLDVSVEREACPLGLAPTASAAAALGMGDALAMALLTAHRFSASDFALYHPGGALGRKLLVVEDVMHRGEDNPLIREGATLKEALFAITRAGVGAVSVVDGEDRLCGLITDGDIRRAIARGNEVLNENVEKLMTKNPRSIEQGKLVEQALRLMEKAAPRAVTVLPVIDESGRAVGILHLTDLMRNGVV